VNAFSYLRITLDRWGGWEKHKRSLKAKRNYTSTWMNKCLARTQSMRLRILHNIYEAICESRLLDGAEIWGIQEGWEEVDSVKFPFSFCIFLKREAWRQLPRTAETCSCLDYYYKVLCIDWLCQCIPVLTQRRRHINWGLFAIIYAGEIKRKYKNWSKSDVEIHRDRRP
jgi:hypothetical protein